MLDITQALPSFFGGQAGLKLLHNLSRALVETALHLYRHAATSRLVQARKPAGKLGGGLGVKKLESKVDEGLFEQAPAAPEPVKPPPMVAAVQQEAEQPAASSRFSYDTLTAVSCVAMLGGALVISDGRGSCMCRGVWYGTGSSEYAETDNWKLHQPGCEDADC